MTKALVIDLETTGVDIHCAEVVQCAILETSLPDLAPGDLWSKLARPRGTIPADASEVHGISDADVAQCAHFSEMSGEISELGADAKTVITFNGNAFDLPILRRILRLPFELPHVDVYRVWQAARDKGIASPGREFDGGWLDRDGCDAPHASRFTGALGSSWSWLTGREPTGEHDAGEDCRMTLDVARALVGIYGLDQCLAWSSGPLPGCVDYAGKFKWDKKGRAVFTFSKYKGIALERIALSQRGFLAWMLREDFHEDTKKIVRAALDGRYPTR